MVRYAPFLGRISILCDRIEYFIYTVRGNHHTMKDYTAANIRNIGIFGHGGEGHLRINIGCPRRYVEEGILRLAVALEG